MASSPSLSAIILAGGRSRRMGRDKALLTLPGGQPLLYRTAQVAHQLTAEVVVVTPWPERYQTVVPPTVRLVKEGQTTSGPLSGFIQGWAQVNSDWCLLLACDLPYLESVVLQRWWTWLLARTEQTEQTGRWRSYPPEESPAYPMAYPAASLISGMKGWEPLCGYYHRSCLAGLTQHLAEGDRAFQTWLATVPIAAYSAIPPSMLFNCNTPDDWTTVERAV